MLLLEFLFFIFIAVLIIVLFFGLRFYFMVRRTMGRFRDFTGGNAAGTQNSYRRRNNDRTKKNPLIIDTRSEEVRNRRIFPEDAGEYVKFKTIR